MAKNMANFAIGFFASICAIFVPRMIAMLNDGQGSLQMFHTDYIVIGCVFAVIIGGITAIFEQQKQKAASETFMTALGIPALLAGALTSGSTGTELQQLESRNQQLSRALEVRSGIAVEETPATLVPLQPTESEAHSRVDFSLISSAHAGEGDEGSNLNFGIQIQQKPYVVVVNRSRDKTEALQYAHELKKTLPRVAVMQSADSYLVVDNPEPMDKSKAMLRAIELKDRHQMKPSLLQVQVTD